MDSPPELDPNTHKVHWSFQSLQSIKRANIFKKKSYNHFSLVSALETNHLHLINPKFKTESHFQIVRNNTKFLSRIRTGNKQIIYISSTPNCLYSKFETESHFHIQYSVLWLTQCVLWLTQCLNEQKFLGFHFQGKLNDLHTKFVNHSNTIVNWFELRINYPYNKTWRYPNPVGDFADQMKEIWRVKEKAHLRLFRVRRWEWDAFVTEHHVTNG